MTEEELVKMDLKIKSLREIGNDASSGEWEYAKFADSEEYGVHIKGHSESKALSDGTISNAVTICRGMTGPKRIQNSQFIAESRNVLPEFLKAYQYLREENKKQKIRILQLEGMLEEEDPCDCDDMDDCECWT